MSVLAETRYAEGARVPISGRVVAMDSAVAVDPFMKYLREALVVLYAPTFDRVVLFGSRARRDGGTRRLRCRRVPEGRETRYGRVVSTGSVEGGRQRSLPAPLARKQNRRSDVVIQP
jgi:hypothetical protein